MSTTTTTTATATTDEGKAPVYAKGTWQHSLQESSSLLDRSAKARKRASALLWDGAKAGIEQWMPNAGDDVSAETLYSDVMEALGKARKGDASKIRSVAIAVRSNGLDLSTFDNLAKAYAEATRLTKTVKQQQAEDDAAEKAIESIEAPKTTGSVDGAAALLLSKGVDGAVVAILDALGATNFDAHRAFVRAMSTEVAARVQAAKPKPAPKKAAAPKKATKASTKKATVKDGTTKAKPVAVSKSKGDPNKKALPKRAEKVEAVEDNTTEAAPVVKKARRAVPVRRKAGTPA